AIGLVDAMRVGPDVGAHWAPPGVGGVEERSTSCLDNTWRAAKLRAMFHGVLWANDPDCVLLRRRNTQLRASDRIGWARWVAESDENKNSSGPACSIIQPTGSVGNGVNFTCRRT